MTCKRDIARLEAFISDCRAAMADTANHPDNAHTFGLRLMIDRIDKMDKIPADQFAQQDISRHMLISY